MMAAGRKGRPQGAERARMVAFARGQTQFYMRDACVALGLPVPRANRLLQSCLGNEIVQRGTAPVAGCKRPVAVYVALAGDMPAVACEDRALPGWWVLASGVVR